jgi:hypothetical protein
MQTDELRRARFPLELLLFGLVGIELAGTVYLLVDAAGAFDLPAGQSPAAVWLEALGFLGLLLTPFICFAVAALGRSLPLGWLLAPACAAYFAAFTVSFDHGADGEVPRNSIEHPFLVTWAIAIGIAALAIGGLTKRLPPAGFALTGLLAVACLLPMIGIALAGH